MFSRQKTQIDIKKSTQKILDRKKDNPTKLKHLRLILDSFDAIETKTLFCTHYEPIYKIVYEGIVLAEANLKQRGVHRAQREELESVLYLLEKILVLCPDNLNGRWQLHSVSRLMAKINHPGNSSRLRREGIRLFLIWYQCLGKNSPAYVHKVFASLVPGFGTSSLAWPPVMDDPTLGVSPLEITPIIPATSSDKQPEDSTSFYLECILDFMISQAPKVHWNGGPEMWAKSMDFLYERFKEFYLPKIFPNFQVVTDIYKPIIELPEPRKSSDMASNVMYTCQVVFVKWIANYAHSVYRSTDCYHPTNVWSIRGNYISHDDSGKLHSSGHSSFSGDRESLTSYSSIPSDVDANVLAKDVILGTRENINMLHEIFRRALLLPFVHSAAIRRVICVYKDWIQINVPELPVFMLEPEEDVVDDISGSGYETPKSRLRTDSYYGAIGFNANNNREEYLSHLRAGAQKVLRVFFCNSAAVFLHVQIPKHEVAPTLLEEQVDICKRVLNIYRYAVMNTRMDQRTWEQLLVVMLHVTSTVLEVNQSHSSPKHQDTLGQKLASAMFQTLIVSWVKASLNVPILNELWDQLESVLSQLTMFDELVTEWAKTMETLTRVLARHVYNLDLTNLPLDRLTEQKAKRKRGMESGASREGCKLVAGTPDGSNFPRKRNISQGTSERKSIIFTPTSQHSQNKLLKRSLSEGNLLSSRKVNGCVSEGHDAADANAKVRRVRKMSKSMDSLKRSIPKEGLALSTCTTVTHQSDWAQISSSTASLENTSTTQMEGDSLDGLHFHHPGKEELKGVIAGGKIRGWLPSVSAILWTRMLGILGNVNQFSNPRTHAHFFQIIADTWSILNKIRQNQGVSLDNLTTPLPPELVPPLLLPAPWCFEAFDLPNEFHRGKVTASALLCDITLSNQDITFQPEYLYKFYATIHKCIINNNQYIVNEIVKRCGIRFISRMLPGFSLLLLDLVQAAHVVLSSDDLRNAPRLEASTLLGSILGVADIFEGFKVLRPNSVQFHSVDAQYTKLVLSYLIQTAKVEQTSHARVIALQSLTIYLCKELTQMRHHFTSSTVAQAGLTVEKHNFLQNIFDVLIASVQVLNRTVVLAAADSLLMLSEFADEVMLYFPKFGRKIILVLTYSLETALPLKSSVWKSGLPWEVEKRLFISLMLTLGEWVMKTPLEILFNPMENEKEKLLSSVFDVLQMVIKGYQTAGRRPSLPINSEGFNPSIPFDDMENTVQKILSVDSGNPAITQDFHTIKLAARSLMSHLLTQFGHFPISNCAARCCSIVSENDDLALDETELQLNIFSLPNLQMFAIDEETLLTMIELPAEECSANAMNGPSMSQVRIILRDLSGKACWDASSLVGSTAFVGEPEISLGVSNLAPVEDQYFHSAITGSFFPQIGARLTVRHRNAGHLPTVENSAEDLDNLDDLLEYIGHTSPECILRSGESLTAPWRTPASLTQEQEDDVIGAVVGQRSSEFEYLLTVDSDVTIRAKSLQYTCDLLQDTIESEENSLSLGGLSKTNLSSSFLRSRRLFSQLGFNGWEKRSNIYLLNKDEKLLRELKHLDNQQCRDCHKIAVIYVAHGQEDKQSILYNTAGSEEFEDFVSGLGWEVELETHTGFMGGLPKNKNSGETAPYYATSLTEVIFHVSTRLPAEEGLLLKTRHLGNDEVHIVWSEHTRDYRRDIIPTEFCDVLIVIYPLRYGLFRIQISKKPEIPYFGPLHNEAIIQGDVLALLVRSTALNASRARRSCLPYFQHHFQERAKTLSTIIQNHKVRTTFEQFAANVFSPVLLTGSFLTGSITRASGSSFTSTVRASSNSSRNSGHAASGFTDHSTSTHSGPHSAPSRRMTTGPNFMSSSYSPYENVTISPSTGRINAYASNTISNESTSTSATASIIPPVPPKRLTIKHGSSIKPKLHTPPASPSTSVRSTPGSIK